MAKMPNGVTTSAGRLKRRVHSRTQAFNICQCKYTHERTFMENDWKGSVNSYKNLNWSLWMLLFLFVVFCLITFVVQL